MSSSAPSFLRRISLAFSSVRRIFKDPDFAHSVALLGASEGIAPVARPIHASSVPLATPAPNAALLLLGLLQKEGRLVDFLSEDIKSHSDQEVGAAARVVHQGCKQVIEDYLRIDPVRDEPEGSRITLQPGFDAASVRPTGNVIGDPPFTGALVHRGWRVVETRLPQVTDGYDPHILAAAEVEL